MHVSQSGMAYRLANISVKPIYRLFQKYRLLVSVKAWTDQMSTFWCSASLLPHKPKQGEQRHETSTVTECGYAIPAHNITYPQQMMALHTFMLEILLKVMYVQYHKK